MLRARAPAVSYVNTIGVRVREDEEGSLSIKTVYLDNLW
jgi:hypothetical protein